jgi:hypothetical protein
MKLNINTIKAGQYVSVKKGVKDPDFDYQLMDGRARSLLFQKTMDL